jgi:tetratricopeptide (TPR) repeat protein
MQAEFHLQQAQLAHRSGRLQDAEHHYRQALQIRPDIGEVNFSLAAVLMLQGKLDEALRAARAGVKARPDHPLAHRRLGDIFAFQGKLGDAEVAYRKAVQLKPDYLEAHNNLGNILLQRGKLEEAEQSYRQALLLRPQFPEALMNLGSIALRRNKPKDALELFQQALQLRPDYAEAYNNLGNAYGAMNLAQDAIRAYEKAIATRGNYGEAYNNLGNALLKQDDFVRAIETLQRAVALMPEAADARTNLGNAYKAVGRLDAAEEAYRGAIALEPESAAAHQNLAMVVCEGDRIGEAFELFTRAAELASLQPSQVNLTGHKRRHDEEQARWMRSSGIVSRGFHLAEAAKAPQAIHVHSHIEEVWRQASPQIVVVDDLLTPEALSRLRNFCLESTFWNDVHDEGYLGAMPESGFAPPLLAQIAEELRSAYPAVFGSHPLLHHWAFKYDSRMSGIRVHADFAAVNVNFWITPDEANLDPDHGGLVIWDVAAPLGWDFMKYNAAESEIRDYLRNTGAKSITVPYRANRAVIFDSDLFHETDVIRFRDGYENRRINVTMLYGRRAGD